LTTLTATATSTGPTFGRAANIRATVTNAKNATQGLARYLDLLLAVFVNASVPSIIS
jgi:hypothetical protein